MNRSVKINYSLLCIFIVYAMAVFIIKMLSPNFLPEKYFYDTNHIIYIMETGKISGDKAFDFAAGFYNALNILNTFDWYDWTFIINIITIPILILFIFILAPVQKKYITFIWVILSFAIIELYILNISKDLIFLFIGLIVYYCIKYTNNRLMLYILLGLISIFISIWFRSYYILMFFFYVFFDIFVKVNRLWKIVLVFISVLLLLIIVPDSIYWKIFDVRTQINYYRIGSTDANSMINDLIVNQDHNRMLGLINYFINILRLAFPIELLVLKKFNITYLMFFVYIVITVTMIINRAIYFNRINRINQNLLLWFVSVFMTLALFEPDYGSYLRHLISYYFIIYPIVNYDPQRGKQNGSAVRGN